ncbi:MAG: aminodeoxychorismate lyase [Colwellia sp.]|jgi:4-amino-4-deoxychorismate lyase|uniref:aminodeoxychorismate lyase n=1 Tax=Colwellia sp. Bg11-12 TaxID=2759817 RepID=UPI0015F57CF8|nr:aminodeoxychorismate lyase [Colwellia sp. Bg11-12]MBA6262391.1 aminodeoxychorismate lyase [Colwellia sp. Bg11-12]
MKPNMYYQSINGQAEQHLSINNRGLAYGDGVFTTAKVVNGHVALLSAHIERLTRSCETLNIPLPDMDDVTRELIAVAQRYALSVAKIIITMGDGGRGYSRQGCLTSNVIITFHDFPKHYADMQQQGIHLGVSSLKLGVNPLLSGIKHLNRLEQVLIRQEVDNREEDDLLVLNYFDDIIEASAANVFWLKDNCWYTPQLNESGVEGLMRNHILQCCNNDRKIIVVKEKLLGLKDIDAMFICNSVMGIMPIRQFQNQPLALIPCHEMTKFIQDVK